MKFFLACLLGAMMSFGWGFVSWMLLGWHEAGFYSFKDETAVAEVIKANVSHGRGIYMLPGVPTPPSFATAEEKKRAEEEHAMAMKEGPYVYAIVRPGRTEREMTTNMLMSFGRSLLACIVMAGLLSRTILTYPGRIAFAAAAGVFAGLVTDAQMWVWFEAPDRELLVNLADHFFEWLLVGAVIGLFVGKAPTANDVR
jgi:hypothetical protein